jgi:hypothetical protein
VRAYLDDEVAAALAEHIDRLDLLSDEVPAVPPQLSSRWRPARACVPLRAQPCRVLYRRSGRLLVLLHIFAKRTAKIPAAEITLAQQRWQDFKTRMDAQPRRPPRAAGHEA